MRVKRHLSLNIKGALNLGKSLNGFLIDENGIELSDKEVKAELKKYLLEGKKVLPMCPASECPDFDYTGGGCPGHNIEE